MISKPLFGSAAAQPVPEDIACHRLNFAVMRRHIIPSLGASRYGPVAAFRASLGPRCGSGRLVRAISGGAQACGSRRRRGRWLGWRWWLGRLARRRWLGMAWRLLLGRRCVHWDSAASLLSTSGLLSAAAGLLRTATGILRSAGQLSGALPAALTSRAQRARFMRARRMPRR